MVSSCKDLVALLHGSCGKEPGMTCGGALGAQELEGTPGTLLQGWVGWRRVLAVGGAWANVSGKSEVPLLHTVALGLHGSWGAVLTGSTALALEGLPDNRHPSSCLSF